jgi:TolA-binding protein
VSTEQPQRSQEKDPVEAALIWIKKHRNPLSVGGAIVIFAAASVWFLTTAQQRKEAFAAAALAEARAVAAAGNPALAASDLDQLVNTYGGTTAGEEAALLIAQIRLLEGQPSAAIEALRRLIDAGPRDQFLAPAHGLLGNAREETGDYQAAAAAYLTAAEAAWYDFLTAEYLLDAGRALELAADTASAIAAYERVLRDYDLDHAQQFAVEARVRLAELRPRDPGIRG